MMKVNAFTSLFLIVVTHFFVVSLGGITYDGLVLTSLDVKPVEGKKGFVKFNGGRKGEAKDETTTFLKNIRQINDKDEDGERIFEAEEVSFRQAKKMLNEASATGAGKPLFCVHGFNVQPGGHLKGLKDHARKFDEGKFSIVPVLWPSKGGVRNYWGDRTDGAPGAGNAFSLIARIDSFPNKSLLCHSMGNFVLRCAAKANIRFDNIFMVAADVRYNLFHKDYIRGGESGSDDGLKICNLLSNKKKGKVHVIYNKDDIALMGGSWMPTTFFSRLGSLGFNKSRNWFGSWVENNNVVDSEVNDCLASFDAGAKLSWMNKGSHGYQFDDFCVEYYQKNHI